MPTPKRPDDRLIQLLREQHADAQRLQAVHHAEKQRLALEMHVENRCARKRFEQRLWQFLTVMTRALGRIVVNTGPLPPEERVPGSQILRVSAPTIERI